MWLKRKKHIILIWYNYYIIRHKVVIVHFCVINKKCKFSWLYICLYDTRVLYTWVFFSRPFQFRNLLFQRFRILKISEFASFSKLTKIGALKAQHRPKRKFNRKKKKIFLKEYDFTHSVLCKIPTLILIHFKHLKLWGPFLLFLGVFIYVVAEIILAI